MERGERSGWLPTRPCPTAGRLDDITTTRTPTTARNLQLNVDFTSRLDGARAAPEVPHVLDHERENDATDDAADAREREVQAQAWLRGPLRGHCLVEHLDYREVPRLTEPSLLDLLGQQHDHRLLDFH